jgi:mycothiol synthase
MNLLIRPAELGPDDETLVDLFNRATRDEPDYIPLTLEEFRVRIAGPFTDRAGRLIAELDGRPVGSASGYVDPLGTGLAGFIGGPRVRPEFRRRGIGRALLSRVLDQLHERGMRSAQVFALSTNAAGLGLAAAAGFAPVRWDLEMRRDLAEIPEAPASAVAVEFSRLGRGPDDARQICDLYNETFAGQYLFRPDTIEETAYNLEHGNDAGCVTDYYVARADDVKGIIATSIDPQECRQEGIQLGWLSMLGVQSAGRRRGIATRLLLRGMQDLKEKGMAEVQLIVDTQNPSHARRLYERIGFTTVRTYITLERPLPVQAGIRMPGSAPGHRVRTPHRSRNQTRIRNSH